jgi:hypothetical protein
MQTFSVEIRAVPNILEYWYMHSGLPWIMSGANSSLRRARTNARVDTTRDAARVT